MMLKPAQLLEQARQVARCAGGRPGDREDLVQETLLRVWRRVRQRGDRGSVRALIRTTLKRVRIDLWRRRSAVLSDNLDQEISPIGAPLCDAEWSELRARLRAAIGELSSEQQEVVRLRYYEGWSFKQIAAAQGVPLNTALGRMHLAAKRLRAILENDRE